MIPLTVFRVQWRWIWTEPNAHRNCLCIKMSMRFAIRHHRSIWYALNDRNNKLIFLFNDFILSTKIQNQFVIWKCFFFRVWYDCIWMIINSPCFFSHYSADFSVISITFIIHHSPIQSKYYVFGIPEHSQKNPIHNKEMRERDRDRETLWHIEKRPLAIMTRATWANFVIWSSIHTICFAMIRNVNSCYWRHTIRRGAFLLISSWTFSLNLKPIPLLTIQIPNSLEFYVLSLIFSLNTMVFDISFFNSSYFLFFSILLMLLLLLLLFLGWIVRLMWVSAGVRIDKTFYICLLLCGGSGHRRSVRSTYEWIYTTIRYDRVRKATS